MSERFDTFGPPPAEPDPWETATGTETGDEDGELDPREAALLLEQTRRDAEQRFDPRPPLMLALAAVTVLFAYGVVWWSVRNQHPYRGPTGAALGIMYGILVVWIVVVTGFLRRARGGISGRAVREQRIAGVAIATVWIFVYVFGGALQHAGASKAIVSGIWPAVAPLVVVGGAVAAYEAAKENWQGMILALVVVAIGAFGAFAGPVGVWGVAAIGLSAVLAVFATAKFLLRSA